MPAYFLWFPEQVLFFCPPVPRRWLTQFPFLGKLLIFSACTTPTHSSLRMSIIISVYKKLSSSTLILFEILPPPPSAKACDPYCHSAFTPLFLKNNFLFVCLSLDCERFGNRDHALFISVSFIIFHKWLQDGWTEAWIDVRAVSRTIGQKHTIFLL